MEVPQKVSDSEVSLKIVTLGDSGVGKSSLIFRYIDGAFHTGYVSTIGVDFKIKKLRIGEQDVKLQIWDTAGQERFRTIATPYLRGAHGCVGVFDVTEPQTLDSLQNWIREFRTINPGASPLSLIVVGNKTDLPKPHVPQERIDAFVSEFHCKYLEASAKTGSEVSTIFETLALSILATRIPQQRNNVQAAKPAQKRWACC